MSPHPDGGAITPRSQLSHLAAFGLVLVIPVLLFLGAILWRYAESERARMQDKALLLAHMIATDVDQNISAVERAMRPLALSDALDRLDTSAIAAEFAAFENRTGLRTFLRDASGAVLAASRSVGDAGKLPPPLNSTSVTEWGAISDLFIDEATQQPSVAIQYLVPVKSIGRASLGLVYPLSRLRKVLEDAHLPPNWTAVIVGRSGVFLMRNVDEENYVGRVNEDFNERARDREGSWSGLAVDGRPIFVAYATSPTPNWRIAVGVSQSELAAPLRRSLLVVGLAGTAVLSLALLMAFTVGRRMTGALGELAASAARMENGRMAPAILTPVREINRVGLSLSQASEGLRERSAELLASRHRLARILDATPSGIVEFGPDGTIVYANQMLERLLEVSSDALIGNRIGDLVAEFADPKGNRLPEDRILPNPALAGESTTGLECVVTTRTGRRLPVSIDVDPIRSADGKVIGAIAAVSDIMTRVMADSARRQIEIRLRTIVDTVPVGIALAEAPSGRIVEANGAIEVILRHAVVQDASEADVGWKAFTEDGKAIDATLFPLARALAGVEERPELECHYERGDGTLAWVKMIGAAIRNDEGAITGAVVAVIDINDIKLAQIHQRLMNRELHHRVRNTLATVQGIANLTARSTKDINVFRQTFADRIVSLSRTHTLLVEHSWAWIPVVDLANIELNPYRSQGDNRITVEGDDVLLPSDVALALGMAFHELTTNAIKHGALSVPEGRVDVRWRIETVEDKRKFILAWSERDGPVVTPPVRSGFGSQLLNNILAQQLNGEVTSDYAPQGLRVVIKSDI